MRNVRVLLAVCLVAWWLPQTGAWAQDDLPSVNDVLEKYFEAIGGKEQYSGVKSMTVNGEISIPEQGVNGKFTIVQQAPNKMRMDMNFEGIGEQSFGHDGDTAWQISAIQGAEILEGEQAEQFAMQAEVTPFLDLDKKFKSVKCTGKEDFDDKSCYVIVVKNPDRDPITHYFSVDSGLHVGTKLTQVSAMGKLEVVNKIGDYKDVDGLKVSHKSTAELPIGMTVVTSIKSIKIDGDIADSKFDLPDEIKELKK